MKKFLKKLLIICMAVIMFIPAICVNAKEKDKESQYLQENKNIIENMKKEMTSVTKSGDAGVDFVKEMIPNSKYEGELSNNLIKYSEDKDVKQYATEMSKKSSEDIEKLKKLDESLNNEIKADTEKEAEYLNDYDEIIKDMVTNLENLKPSGNLDKDYLNVIIIYKQNRCKLCELILKYTDNASIKQNAENGIKDSKTCIEKVNKLLQKDKK